MRSTPRSFIAAALLTAMAPPCRALAQTQLRSWTVCSPGAIRACSSVRLATTPIVTTTGRIGTALVIMVRNLQGTMPADNTVRSTLYAIDFFGARPAGAADYNSILGYPGTPEGPGASGDGSNYIRTQVHPGGLWLRWGDAVGSGGAGVSGCVPGPLVDDNRTALPFLTCGADAWITFSRTTGAWVDAEDLDRFAFATLAGTRDQTFTGTTAAYFCNSSDAGCEVVEGTVTPEPASLVLVGSGLVALGTSALRRRRRTAG